MKKTAVFGRRVTQLSPAHVVRVRLSSLVDVGFPSQCSLALTISRPASHPLQDGNLGYCVPLPPSHFLEARECATSSIVCHVTGPVDAFKNYAYRTQAQDRPSQKSQLAQLQNEAPQENTEPIKPDKPKWEEEQYPDIGKSTSLLLTLMVAIDILSNQLPFLLIQPLPKRILSSKIELVLFPSSYPSIPPMRLPKFVYRSLFRSVRWIAPVALNRTLRSFGSPSGVKGIGLEITCLRVIKIENGRRVEARWRTASSPWSTKPESSAPRDTEEMPKTWSGWFYFDINRKGLIVKHVVENVNNQRKEEGEGNLKDILVRTVTNGRALGEGYGSVVTKEKDLSEGFGPPGMRIVPRIFPRPSSSNIIVFARTYC